MLDTQKSYSGRYIGGGKYELLEPTGAGAMGVVWLARHVALERMVAVKLLHKAITDHPDAHARFVREAQTASSLRHKHMVQVLDFGGDPETGLFLVMEYIEGRNLSEIISEEGPIAPARALNIASQVLAGLAEAHELGIVHRDIKPANVMLLPMTDDDGVEREQVKVFDFGIATMRDAANASKEIAGTPEYMSPEQVRGTDIDHRSDIYSVGIMLYAMLTGHVPFSFESAMDTMLAQANKAPTPLRQKDPRLSEALDEAVMRSLAKGVEARFTTARSFRQALLALPEMTTPVTPAPSMVLPAQPMSTVRAERVESRSSKGWLFALLAVLLVGGGAGLWAGGVFESAAPQTERVAAAEPAKKVEPVAEKVEVAPAKVEHIVKVVEVPVPVPQVQPAPAKAEPVVAEAVVPEPAKIEPAKPEPVIAKVADKKADRDKHKKVEPTPEPVVMVAEAVKQVAPEPAKVEPAAVAVAHPVEPAKVEPAKVEPAKVAPTFTASAGFNNVSVQGSLTRSSVARAVESARAGVEQCYATASRAANRDAACGAPVSFIIDVDGRVRGVDVGSMALPGLSACVAGAMGRVRLKDRPDTGTVEVSFQLRLSPKDH